jgi:hypothetical protein
MGCDIHLWSETKKEGVWVADLLHTLTTPTQAEIDDGEYADITYSYRGRDYGLFGLLTNGEVRYECPFGLPNHGMAEDLSPEVAAIFERWEDDAHSHNHLTVQELKEKAMQMLVSPDLDARELLPRLTRLIDGLPKTDNPNLEEQRIVFFFDN